MSISDRTLSIWGLALSLIGLIPGSILGIYGVILTIQANKKTDLAAAQYLQAQQALLNMTITKLTFDVPSTPAEFLSLPEDKRLDYLKTTHLELTNLASNQALRSDTNWDCRAQWAMMMDYLLFATTFKNVFTWQNIADDFYIKKHEMLNKCSPMLYKS